MDLDEVFRFAVGGQVVLEMHNSKLHSGHIGRVCYREFFQDSDAEGRRFYGVRWLSPEGKVADSLTRHEESELSFV